MKGYTLVGKDQSLKICMIKDIVTSLFVELKIADSPNVHQLGTG